MKHLYLIDKDIVELSNLNRQFMYTQADLGQSKVRVLANALEARFPSTRIETLENDIQSCNLESLFEGYNAGLVTVDEPLGLAAQIRRWACRRMTLVTALYSNHNAVVSLASESRLHDLEHRQWIRLPSTVAPSFGPLNAELAGLATTVLLHSIMGDLGSVHETGWNVFGFPREYAYANS